VLFAYVLNTTIGEQAMTEKALSIAIPVSIELAGIFILIIGIAVEISTGADIGHVLISVGSAVIACGSILWAKIMKLSGKKG
jgi:FtsH-binding integral membrane protein